MVSAKGKSITWLGSEGTSVYMNNWQQQKLHSSTNELLFWS
ncbi:hypothetical protein PULV_a2094 [Pseudoalteromonas ulvae UL12]|nr:hypothetical protein [Pseudoalteromonas ulvae UL12]